MPLDPRHRSRTLVDGPDRAPARAMLKSVGYDTESLRRPLVMVAHSWIGTMPCNFNQRDLAAEVMRGIREAGGTPMEVNTVSISDGIAMGTEGMKASLISREVVADSIELCGRGYLFDAAVVIVGCDKTIPGGVMGLSRLGVPGLVLYSGSIAPGTYEGQDVTIQDVFEAVGRHAAGSMTDDELTALEDVACPGAGACGAQYTANTMATAIEFLGISPMGSGSSGATDPRKQSAGYEAGQLVMDVLARGQLPGDVMTREAFENAIVCVASTGARRTRSCTCWRWRGRSGSSSASTTSTRSASARRSSETCGRAAVMSRLTWTARAARACSPSASWRARRSTATS